MRQHFSDAAKPLRPVALMLFVAVLCTGCEGDQIAEAYASAKRAIDNRLAGKPPIDSQTKPRKKRKRSHLVELADVKSEPLHITTVYSGSLRARRLVRVHSQEEGRITEIALFEGDAVAAGQRLFALDDALLRAAASKADAVLAEANANVKRLNKLRKRRMVGEDEFLRAQTSLRVAEAERRVLETRLGYTTISAPFTGVLTERFIEPGDVVDRHQHVLTVIDPTSLTLDLRIAEELVALLKPGDKVRVRIDALGVSDYPAAVARLFPEVDPRTRQGRIEVALDPVPANARPGQFARVTFDLNTFARTVVPFGALRRDRDAEYVFVVDKQQSASRVVVRSGRRVADKVQILEGLEPGQKVVLRGFLGLTAGKQVKPVKPATARKS